MLEWNKSHLPINGINFRLMPSMQRPHGSHCLSCEFIGLAKLPLEKQTSKPSLLMALCMCSVQVQLLAGTIKWNRPGVTIQLVFQNPVTDVLYHYIAIMIVPILTILQIRDIKHTRLLSAYTSLSSQCIVYFWYYLLSACTHRYGWKVPTINLHRTSNSALKKKSYTSQLWKLVYCHNSDLIVTFIVG